MRTHFIPNPVRIDGDVAYLKLVNRQGEFVAEAMIDLDDLGRVLAAGRWYATRNRLANCYYVRRNSQMPIMLHRFVMDDPDGLDVDHRDHNTLDCRKKNLRPCTHSGNMQNRTGVHKNNRSGARGVYWDPKNSSWRVQVWANKQKFSLGSYKDLADAERAAIEGRRLHGEFAA